MTDKFRINIMPAKEFDLKIKNNKQSIDITSDSLDPTLFPCPDLRRDIIDNRNAELMKKSGHQQIHPRIINEKSSHRFFPAYGFFEITNNLSKKS